MKWFFFKIHKYSKEGSPVPSITQSPKPTLEDIIHLKTSIQNFHVHLRNEVKRERKKERKIHLKDIKEKE